MGTVGGVSFRDESPKTKTQSARWGGYQLGVQSAKPSPVPSRMLTIMLEKRFFITLKGY